MTIASFRLSFWDHLYIKIISGKRIFYILVEITLFIYKANNAQHKLISEFQNLIKKKIKNDHISTYCKYYLIESILILECRFDLLFLIRLLNSRFK